MNSNRAVIAECILVYISLFLNFAAIVVNRTLSLGINIMLALGCLFVLTKMEKFYDTMDIKVFDRIKLTHLGKISGLIAYLIFIFRIY